MEAAWAKTGHGEVTELLLAWSGGETSALDKLMPLVYAELHRLARRYMRRERGDHTLQTSELINEAYLRLVDANRINCRDRAHFLAVAAQAMRRILVEHARARGSQRRGAGVQPLALEAAANVHAPESPDLVKLDEALTALAESIRAGRESSSCASSGASAWKKRPRWSASPRISCCATGDWPASGCCAR
jgi:RNA polymerase sigma-70 factor, ECF subfamily